MICWDEFENAVVSHLGRDIRRQSNPDQNRAIRAPINQSLFIVAGPGSGKTTVIALRVLKLIFVDDIDPSSILVTTFTRKAATELRSRILGWGDQLRRIFINSTSHHHIRNQLQRLDLNRIITGTIDSIAEETLGDYRAPGAPPPAVIEDFVSNGLMIRQLFNHGRFRNTDLRDYLVQLNGEGFGIVARSNLIPAKAAEMLCEIKDRFFHDQINISQFRNSSSHPGVPVACNTIQDYIQELRDRFLFDFALLEQAFLDRLRNDTLNRFLQQLRFILVDEYQDTNLLQEQIYFEIARAALRNGGSITVVGDDDQSLYRFRGATVDLFQEFQNRINNKLYVNPTIIYLSRNYRSTQNIVSFCNDFITLDSQYQGARVQNKPPIRSARLQPYDNYPVLGMFRENVEELAHDLARFIHRVIYGGGVQVRDSQGNRYTIEIDPQGGSPADVALLCSSPREFDGQGNPRLPRLLREELSQLSPLVQIFNPRGQNLELIPDVQRLCGLILECIDPHGRVQNNTRLPQIVQNIFNAWRCEAVNYINTNPPPHNPSLSQFVRAWQRRNPLGRRHGRIDPEVSLISLVYKLVTWIPSMQNDIEGLVYLEAITRTINQAGLFGNFGGQIIFDPSDPRAEPSIREALWNIFMPIATGAIEINEDLLETLPSDRLNIMSIHQAKGLEFPLVIVDVGSDFRKCHHAHAFKRFPNNGGKSCNMEDELRPYSPLGIPQRSALDRAFDDLIRQYFVAFSRAQDVLMLVGLNSVRDGYFTSSGRREIPNIATGWDRNRNWIWGRGLPNLIHI